MIHLFYDKKKLLRIKTILHPTQKTPKNQKPKKPTKNQQKLKEFENDYCTLKTECMCVNIKC